jgi:hypothetical protein
MKAVSVKGMFIWASSRRAASASFRQPVEMIARANINGKIIVRVIANNFKQIEFRTRNETPLSIKSFID